MSSEIIGANFDPEAVQITRDNIVTYGAEATEKSYLESGLHPSYVKAIMKRALKLFVTKKKT